MDESMAARIAAGIEERYPNARVVHAGEDPVYYVYWTDGPDEGMHSFLLGETEGKFGVDVYRGDRMKDEGAPFLSTFDFNESTVDQVINELRGTPAA